MHRPRFAGDKITLGLRLSIIVCDIIAFGFLLGAMSLHGHYFYMDGSGGVIDAVSLAPVLVSLIWTSISLLLNFFKGVYHPGVDVGMELCSWGVIGGMVWFLIAWLGFAGPYDSVGCSARHYEDCTVTIERLLFASEVIAAMAIVVCGVMHFTLFVSACRETHLRRQLKREARLDDDEPRELAEHVVVITQSKQDIA